MTTQIKYRQTIIGDTEWEHIDWIGDAEPTNRVPTANDGDIIEYQQQLVSSYPGLRLFGLFRFPREEFEAADGDESLLPWEDDYLHIIEARG